jgi:hypothetical protein
MPEIFNKRFNLPTFWTRMASYVNGAAVNSNNAIIIGGTSTIAISSSAGYGSYRPFTVYEGESTHDETSLIRSIQYPKKELP